MQEIDAEEGVEVVHPTHGRGTIVEYSPNFGAEPDDLSVQFYESGETRELPVYAVDVAQEVVTANVENGTHGFRVTVDDGYYLLDIQPDGSGGGYTIELREKGETLDSATLSHTD
jgi:hypothetical protein